VVLQGVLQYLSAADLLDAVNVGRLKDTNSSNDFQIDQMPILIRSLLSTTCGGLAVSLANAPCATDGHM
jgi:hypothetical protein